MLAVPSDTSLPSPPRRSSDAHRRSLPATGLPAGSNLRAIGLSARRRQDPARPDVLPRLTAPSGETLGLPGPLGIARLPMTAVTAGRRCASTGKATPTGSLPGWARRTPSRCQAHGTAGGCPCPGSWVRRLTLELLECLDRGTPLRAVDRRLGDAALRVRQAGRPGIRNLCWHRVNCDLAMRVRGMTRSTSTNGPFDRQRLRARRPRARPNP